MNESGGAASVKTPKKKDLYIFLRKQIFKDLKVKDEQHVMHQNYIKIELNAHSHTYTHT